MVRLISRKRARELLGDISSTTLWRMQVKGLLPASADLPRRPFREDELLEAIAKLAERNAPRDGRNRASDPQATTKPKVTGAVIAGRKFTAAQVQELNAEAERRGLPVRALVSAMFPDAKLPTPEGSLFPESEPR